MKRAETTAVERASTTQGIALGIFSNWFNFGLTALLAFVTAPILVERLGQQGYGLWSLYMAMIGYFSLLDFGISPALVRQTSRLSAMGQHRDILPYASACLWLLLLAGTIVGVCGVLIASVYETVMPNPGIGVDAARVVLLLVFFDFALNLACAVAVGILLGNQRYVALNGLNSLLRILRFILILKFVTDGDRGIVDLAWIWFGTGILRDVGLIFLARRVLPELSIRPNFSLKIIRDLIEYGVPAFIISIAIRVISYTDSLVISYVIGIGSVTYYALALSLVDYAYEIGWGLAGVLVPLASRYDAQGNTEAIAQYFLDFTRYCALLMAPIMMISFALGPSFFTAWIGVGYDLSAEILNVLMFAMTFYVVLLPGHAVLKGTSRHGRLALFLILEAVFNFFLSLILARQWGVIGVAYGTLIPRAIFSGIFLTLYLLHVLRLSLGEYLRSLLLPVLPGSFAMIVVYILPLFPWREPLGWGGMVAAGASLALVFVLPTYFLGLKPNERQQIRDRLRRIPLR